MKSFLFSIPIVLLFVSCEQDALTKHLETGLVNYDRTRPVNEKLIDNIILENIAIFKTAPQTFKLVLKLNNKVKKEEVEIYKIAMEAYLDEENIKLRKSNTNNNKQGFNLDVNFEVYDTHKYIINTIVTDIKAFKRVDIWFYLIEKGQYKDPNGNRILIKNIGL